MNLHTSTRIPIDDEYALLIGKGQCMHLHIMSGQ